MSASTAFKQKNKKKQQSSNKECLFCSRSNHVMEQCHLFRNAQKQAKDQVLNKNTAKANAAEAQPAEEFAGNASTRSLDHSDPSLPLQLNADFDWLADTGATSHMTPHRYWFKSYKPYKVTVCLADDSVIYSAGVGTRAHHHVIGLGPSS